MTRDTQAHAAYNHESKRQIRQWILVQPIVQYRKDNKISNEHERNIFKRYCAKRPPESWWKSVAKRRQGKERQKIGAECPDPKEYHAGSQPVKTPEDKPDMDRLCRSEREA